MRYSTRLLIFLIILNASATAMVQSGVAADWNIQPNPGGDERLENARENASEFEPSGGFADTLFGLYNSIAGIFSDILGVVTAGPQMIQNLGVPGWLTALIFAPLYLLIAIDSVYILTARET